jgi:hypothetical protein
MAALREVFGDSNISSGLCAERSVNLHPYHFYSRGAVKQMFTDQTVTQSKNSRKIAQGTISLFPKEFQLVNVNFRRRYGKYVRTTEGIPEIVVI